MAYDDIEVEIKLKADDAVVEAIKEKLLKNKPTQKHHIDTYAEAATRLLKPLGFEPLVTVNKHRTEALIDDFLVSVDEVEEIGSFVEIEATKSYGSIKDTLKTLNDYATKLGLDTSNVTHKGYPHLLLEHHLGHELTQ